MADGKREMEVELVEPMDGDRGNTKRSPRKQPQPSRRVCKDTRKRKQVKTWICTINNYGTDDRQALADYVRSFGAGGAWVLGYETGESGTPHIQGVCKFPRRMELSVLHEAFPRAHWEPCKFFSKSVKYCMKDGDFISFGVKVPEKLIDPMEGLVYYPWQKEIIDICNTQPDRRTINWYWDDKGCSGKTTLALHMSIIMEGVIVCGGKAADIMYQIQHHVKKSGFPKIVLFNLVRSREGFVSYEGLESVKDCIFAASKYKGGMVRYNPIHLFVFANFQPDTTKLSQDRWRIRWIDE